MDNKIERQLAAIMFTDMVGYSALAQENEMLALQLLEEHRKILRPLLSKHGGREVETIGDAFFIEFSSALEATKCAIDIQREFWTRNEIVKPNQRISIRIGIHLGDVVHKAENVLGDEVNIAARIEPLASPGGICISEDVARQVRNKIEYPLKKLKRRQLKNINLPVDVFAIILPWNPEDNITKWRSVSSLVFISLITLIAIVFIWQSANKSILSGSSSANYPKSSEWQNSIAVLPFTDMSPQQDQEYFCDGITDQILTNLAKLGSLKVIARTSVMKFKSSDKTIREIGNELQVNTILEGSVRRSGNQLRVTAQLINAKDGSHLWAEDYNKEYTELFAIQDAISTEIAGTLIEKLTEKETAKMKSERPVDLEAYEYFLKGEYIHRNNFWSTKSKRDFREAERMFLKAIELDSLYAPSFAGLVDLYNTYFNTVAKSDEEKKEFMDLQEKYIQVASKLDDQSAFVNRVIGWVYSAKNDSEKQFKYLKKACEIDPNDPENNLALGISYDIIGLEYHAHKYYSRCIELDPYYAKYHYHLANVDFHLGSIEKARQGFKKALDLEPYNEKYISLYAWVLIISSEFKEAEILIKKFDQRE